MIHVLYVLLHPLGRKESVVVDNLRPPEDRAITPAARRPQSVPCAATRSSSRWSSRRPSGRSSRSGPWCAGSAVTEVVSVERPESALFKQRRSKDDRSLLHSDLLEALFEGLGVDGEEDRTYLRERYFERLQAERELKRRLMRRDAKCAAPSV